MEKIMRTKTSNFRHRTSNNRKMFERAANGCWMLVVGCWLFILFFAANALAAETNSLLTAWLDSQTNIQTWSADLIETRSLKSLTQPLTATGHVYFAAPNRFHWELGNPPQTIAVRSGDEMRVIYPKLKRAEIYPLNAAQSGPWRDALALLQAGFPRSRAEMESQFRVMSETVSNQMCEVTLQPKSAGARRMMPQIKIAFATNDFSLRATELQFADGSTMRNEFSHPQLNLKLDDSLFAPKLPPDYKIIEPLKK
jgi:outer membrane lipoprotein-sorting protein